MKHKADPTKAERYTPVKYVEMVREVLGKISLDPASCKEANNVVKARYYYTIETDGLNQCWFNEVFLNPPYKNVLPWVQKLFSEMDICAVTKAILLVNASTDTKWFYEICNNPLASPVFCFVNSRIRFDSPTGAKTNQPRYPSVFIYFGSNSEKFKQVFGKIGAVMTLT